MVLGDGDNVSRALDSKQERAAQDGETGATCVFDKPLAAVDSPFSDSVKD
jgi:hypothetical protein